MLKTTLTFLFCCTFAVASFGLSVPVAGTWEGESKCTVPDSPCHDEHVIYRIKADKQPDAFLIDAFKVVGGEEQFMGAINCRFKADSATLSCTANTRMKDDWEFKLSGDEMTGTLVIGDEKKLYRRVSVKKK